MRYVIFVPKLPTYPNLSHFLYPQSFVKQHISLLKSNPGQNNLVQIPPSLSQSLTILSWVDSLPPKALSKSIKKKWNVFIFIFIFTKKFFFLLL